MRGELFINPFESSNGIVEADPDETDQLFIECATVHALTARRQICKTVLNAGVITTCRDVGVSDFFKSEPKQDSRHY